MADMEAVRATARFLGETAERLGFNLDVVEISAASDTDVSPEVQERIAIDGTAFEYADHIHMTAVMRLPAEEIRRDAITGRDRLKDLAEGLSMNSHWRILLGMSTTGEQGRVLIVHVSSTPIEACGTFIEVTPQCNEAQFN